MWGQSYVDEMVLRDAVKYGGGNYGISGSGLDQRLYPTTDANWNTTGLVAPGGTMEQNFIYDPYGNAQEVNANATSAVTDAYSWLYLHQGGRVDLVTGLINHRQRDYIPPLGRWAQQEPSGTGYIDGPNLYLDELDNPVDLLDPQGTVGGYTPPVKSSGNGTPCCMNTMPYWQYWGYAGYWACVKDLTNPLIPYPILWGGGMAGGLNGILRYGGLKGIPGSGPILAGLGAWGLGSGIGSATMCGNDVCTSEGYYCKGTCIKKGTKCCP